MRWLLWVVFTSMAAVPGFYLGTGMLLQWVRPTIFGNEDVLTAMFQLHVVALAVVAMLAFGVSVAWRRRRREVALGGFIGVVLCVPAFPIYTGLFL
jgi:hypothetical protein